MENISREDMNKIKNRIYNLLHQILPTNQYDIKFRNESIINMVCNEFNVSREIVEECFDNVNSN